MILGTGFGGIRGAAIAHVAVAFLIVVPAFSIALRRAGVLLKPLAATMIRPFIATVVMIGFVYVVDQMIEPDALALMVGGAAGAFAYAAAVVRWRDGKPDISGTLQAVREARD
jgi:PST family polysaccharide transporter